MNAEWSNGRKFAAIFLAGTAFWAAVFLLPSAFLGHTRFGDFSMTLKSKLTLSSENVLGLTGIGLAGYTLIGWTLVLLGVRWRRSSNLLWGVSALIHSVAFLLLNLVTLGTYGIILIFTVFPIIWTAIVAFLSWHLFRNPDEH